MRTQLPKFFLLLILFIAPFLSYSQGCSDAGICTISSIKPNNNDSLLFGQNQIKAGISYGFADNAIFIVGNYLEYDRELSSRFSIQLKLTSLLQSGNDISAFGLSDIFLNANYKITKKTGITLGFKIPLSDANEMLDGLSLPMDYQSSLGTFDLLLGISQEIKKLQLSLALQLPLSQNSNAFFADKYPTDSPLRNIQSTNKYVRSGDLLLRISYPFTFGKKFKLTPSILPIYHLANDKYTTIDNIETTIEGSQGLTLNGNVYLDYRINQKNGLQLSLGLPFIVRDARPDGLTRKYVVNLEYIYAF